MHPRFAFLLVSTAVLGAASVPAQNPDRRIVLRDRDHFVADGYQGRNGPEQSDRFSRKLRIGRNGSFVLFNISGDIAVTGGGGAEVSIEAVKRTRGDRSQLSTVDIEVVERGSRVEVRTNHTGRNERVSVDYTVTVPADATVELKSVSGSIKMTSVNGAVRLETISGNITTASTPRVELAKSVSGNIDLTGTSVEGELAASTVSGTLRAKGVKARALQLGSVSGDVYASDVTCDRLEMKSVSGNLEFMGGLAKSGRYELNSHSGTIRLGLSGDTGFELNADSFSGSIRSDFPVTLGTTSAQNERRRPGPGRATRAVYGDGSAVLTIRTFSGDVVITRGK